MRLARKGLTEGPGSFPADYQPPDSRPDSSIAESAADHGTVRQASRCSGSNGRMGEVNGVGRDCGYWLDIAHFDDGPGLAMPDYRGHLPLVLACHASRRPLRFLVGSLARVDD